LATVQQDLSASWVLHLLDKYPTPPLLARARLSTLQSIPFVPAQKVERLQELARTTIGSLGGATAGHLVRGLLAQLRQSRAAEEDLKEWMVTLYGELPEAPPLTTIPGIGDATAAVLVAKMVTIDRFANPAAVVGYFGLFAEEYASGVDKQGESKASRASHMSRKGNDLVRKYLWNAAKTATLHNPAIRALYRRLVARGRRGDVALGHCMRKLVHLVFAVWKTGKPFDRSHYPWEPAPADTSVSPTAQQPDTGATPAASADSADLAQAGGGHSERIAAPAPATSERSQDTQTPEAEPVAARERKAREAPTAAGGASSGSMDFAFLRSQISMEQVLAHLGHLHELTGSGPQRRGRCPVHSSSGQGGRTFSVHLGKNVFQCFHPPCGIKGNVLDLWAAVLHLPLREAALHLASTFNLQAYPPRTEKRNP
jgi:hypothetical protein